MRRGAHGGTGTLACGLGPSVADRPGVVEWWGRVERYGATPGTARARLGVHARARRARRAAARRRADARAPQPRQRRSSGSVTAATSPSTFAARGSSSVDERRPLAAARAGSARRDRGVRHGLAAGDRRTWIDSSRPCSFVDVVGSTEQVSELGDRSWSRMRDRFEEAVRTVARRVYGGRLVDVAGDGVLATFDGPARAIRCAWHIRDEVRRAGLEVRCGLHAGEVTRRADDVAGSPCTSVHACRRSPSRARCS